MRVFLLLNLIIAFILTSCKKEEIPVSGPIDPPSFEETYTSVKNIFDLNCLGCHSQNQNSYITDLTNYNSIKSYLDNVNNTMIDRLNSPDEFYRMPPSGDLSNNDRESLINWINGGYVQ